MKLNIAICDDEKTQRDYLIQLVSKWAVGCNCSCAVSAYDSAEAYLFSMEDRGGADVLLLDVQMKAIDGVSLAKKLRQADERVQIIFITGFPDYMAEGYEVSALHYLMKPVDERKLFDTLDRAARLLAEKPRVVMVKTADGVASVRAESIYYAEVFSHDTELHTEDGTYRLKMSMKELEKLLGDGFFRCHRSYIAGLAHVRKVTRAALLLDNGKELPLSRGQYNAANQAFIRYN